MRKPSSRHRDIVCDTVCDTVSRVVLCVVSLLPLATLAACGGGQRVAEREEVSCELDLANQCIPERWEAPERLRELEEEVEAPLSEDAYGPQMGSSEPADSSAN